MHDESLPEQNLWQVYRCKEFFQLQIKLWSPNNELVTKYYFRVVKEETILRQDNQSWNWLGPLLIAAITSSCLAACQGAESTPGQGATTMFDLQTYMVESDALYLNYRGKPFGRYRFYDATRNFQHLYQNHFSTGVDGKLMIWEKSYFNPLKNHWNRCPQTYALLLYGSSGTDRRIYELGDWYTDSPDSQDCVANLQRWRTIEYFQRVGNKFHQFNTGLAWAGSAGINMTGLFDYDIGVFSNNKFTNYLAMYSTRLVNHFDVWRPDYGSMNGVWRKNPGNLPDADRSFPVYSDVIEIIMYHGVKSALVPKTGVQRCGPEHYDAANVYSSYYYDVRTRRPITEAWPGYEIYAMQLYIAKGKGIVQERLLFSESDYFGKCVGYGMKKNVNNINPDPKAYAWYRS